MAREAVLSRGPSERSGMRLEDTWLWRLKLRLQFTGWLQYVINAIVALIFLLLAGVGWMIGVWPIALIWTPLGIGALLLVNLAFDLATVKFGLRPAEALPKRRDDLDVFDLMRVRRACRSFQARDLREADRAELLESVRRNSQPERQIGKSTIRFEYVAAPLTVWPVVGAHEFLVAIAPRAYDRLAVIDVGRSLQKIVLHATRMGLATCWIGPGADQKSIAHHLGARFNPDKDHVICVCALGYACPFKPLFIRFMQLTQHRRLPVTSLFFADPRFATPLDRTAPPFAAYGRCYEVCEWSPSSYNSQTTRCAVVMARAGGVERLARFDFCAATNSRYYAAVTLGIWLANWETGCAALGKPGHFAVLTPAQRGVAAAPPLPRYDVSWIVDEVGTP
jgi:nitroreductase